MNNVPVLPFRQGTRRHRMVLDNVIHQSTQNGVTLDSIELKPAGWLAGLIVNFTGTVTTGASAAWGDRGPWGIAKRFVLELNGQAFAPIDIDGYSAYIAMFARRSGGSTDRAHWGAAAVDSAVYAGSIAASTSQTVTLTWFLPLALNDGANCETGLLPLLARELTGFLKISTESLANLGTAITGVSGTWKTTAVYFNNPVDTPSVKYAKPPLQACRLISFDNLIRADNSDQAIVLPREGTIVELAHIIRVNGVRQDYFDNVRLVLGNSNVQDRADKYAVKAENAVQYGELPTGVIFHQLSDDYQGNIKGLRDSLDTTGIALSESVIAINTGGAGLGASNNIITSVARIVTPLNYQLN